MCHCICSCRAVPGSQIRGCLKAEMMPLSLILLDFRKPTRPWWLIKYAKQSSEQMNLKPSSVLSLTLSSSGGFRLGWARIPQLGFSEWLWPSSFCLPRNAGGRKLARDLLLHYVNFTLKSLVRQVPVEGFVWELNAFSILSELDFCHPLHSVSMTSSHVCKVRGKQLDTMVKLRDSESDCPCVCVNLRSKTGLGHKTEVNQA